MSAPTLSNADMADLKTVLREALRTGGVSPLAFNAHRLERLLAVVTQCTSTDMRALTDISYDDTADGRPISS